MMYCLHIGTHAGGKNNSKAAFHGLKTLLIPISSLPSLENSTSSFNAKI